jgi:hypothetical protein
LQGRRSKVWEGEERSPGFGSSWSVDLGGENRRLLGEVSLGRGWLTVIWFALLPVPVTGRAGAEKE